MLNVQLSFLSPAAAVVVRSFVRSFIHSVRSLFDLASPKIANVTGWLAGLLVHRTSHHQTALAGLLFASSQWPACLTPGAAAAGLVVVVVGGGGGVAVVELLNCW